MITLFFGFLYIALSDLNRKKPNLTSAFRNCIYYKRKAYFNLYKTLISSLT